jgi:hypothetical protein
MMNLTKWEKDQMEKARDNRTFAPGVVSRLLYTIDALRKALPIVKRVVDGKLDEAEYLAAKLGQEWFERAWDERSE